MNCIYNIVKNKNKNVFKWSTKLSIIYANTKLSVGLRPIYCILWCGVLYRLLFGAIVIVTVAHELLLLFTSLRLLFPMGLTLRLFISTCLS